MDQSQIKISGEETPILNNQRFKEEIKGYQEHQFSDQVHSNTNLKENFTKTDEQQIHAKTKLMNRVMRITQSNDAQEVHEAQDQQPWFSPLFKQK